MQLLRSRFSPLSLHALECAAESVGVCRPISCRRGGSPARQSAVKSASCRSILAKSVARIEGQFSIRPTATTNCRAAYRTQSDCFVLVQGGLSNAGDHSTYTIISSLYISKQKTLRQGVSWKGMGTVWREVGGPVVGGQWYGSGQWSGAGLGKAGRYKAELQWSVVGGGGAELGRAGRHKACPYRRLSRIG